MLLFRVCNYFVTLGGRRAVRSTVTYYEQVLCRGLWFDFDTAYNVFSALIALSNALGSSDYRATWRHTFRKIAFKNCENPKNR